MSEEIVDNSESISDVKKKSKVQTVLTDENIADSILCAVVGFVNNTIDSVHAVSQYAINYPSHNTKWVFIKCITPNNPLGYYMYIKFYDPNPPLSYSNNDFAKGDCEKKDGCSEGTCGYTDLISSGLEVCHCGVGGIGTSTSCHIKSNYSDMGDIMTHHTTGQSLLYTIPISPLEYFSI